MGRSLRIAALQMRAHDRDSFAHERATMLDAIGAAARGCDLLVLPEGTLPAYVLGEAPLDMAEQERALAGLRDIAKAEHCVIVCGVATQREGKLYNSAVVIERDGTIAGSADKIFLWAFDRKWFTAGQRIEPVQTSIGSLGVMICADGRMPVIARTLVDRGAELLVMPTAWVTSGRDPATLENLQADLLARVRAFENGVPFIAANKCGVERGMVLYCGKSQIVGDDGAVVAMASQLEPERIVASMTLGNGMPQRTAFEVPERLETPRGTERIAISLDAPMPDLRERLNVLDAQRYLNADDTSVLDARWAFDPGFLPAYRAAGRRFVALVATETDPWIEPIARARASELRMYVVVFDRARDRAYAIDPDGVLVAGTTRDFRIATAAIDYARTEQTFVAPGTDVAAGLMLVESLA